MKSSDSLLQLLIVAAVDERGFDRFISTIAWGSNEITSTHFIHTVLYTYLNVYRLLLLLLFFRKFSSSNDLAFEFCVEALIVRSLRDRAHRSDRILPEARISMADYINGSCNKRHFPITTKETPQKSITINRNHWKKG